MDRLGLPGDHHHRRRGFVQSDGSVRLVRQRPTEERPDEVREVNVETWIVEYRDLDDVLNGTWTRSGVYNNDEPGARDDYRILKNVYASVRIGKIVTKIEWEDHELHTA